MSNSAMPNLPGFGAIAESMELGRKLWGSTGWTATGVPGMTAPMLSAEEIDKQIADLKAVEAWLTLNMNMLRGTIQTLEVQSATISALKSMGEAFKNASAPVAASPATGFSFPFAASAQSNSSAAAPAQESPTNPPVEGITAPSMTDPTAWWNMLQSQFKQAMNAAAVTTPHTPADTSADTNAPATPPAAPASEAASNASQPLVDQPGAKGEPGKDQRLSPAAESSDANSAPTPSASSKRTVKDLAKDVAKPPR